MFEFLSLVIIASALSVVALRNPIHSALSLITCLIGVAGMFAFLDAHFLAVVQIVVYAGAIVVLVLFLLMLLNIKVERRARKELLFVGTAVTVGVVFLCAVIPSLISFFSIFNVDSREKGTLLIDGTVKGVGKVLYTSYIFPFEAASVVIMVAVVGAVMLAKRRYREVSVQER